MATSGGAAEQHGEIQQSEEGHVWGAGLGLLQQSRFRLAGRPAWGGKEIKGLMVGAGQKSSWEVPGG